ncbi:MAG: hypothetical protein HC800_12215 [Phormidesmis sp. RL_2_1]|nr:hypothetical protein [Phormidesmis sp. RL_2_1]
MQTKLIALEVSLLEVSLLEASLGISPDELRSRIEAQLAAYGTPLRWAITSTDAERQIAYIEAVVTIP